jgi:phospholipase C
MSARRRLGALLCLPALLVAAVSPPARPALAAGPPAATPIQHLVVLMQAKHSFDNYFGAYPGADGIPAGVCMPVNPADPTAAPCVTPAPVQGSAIRPLADSLEAFRAQYRGGRMDGFIDAFRRMGQDGGAAMDYYTEQDLAFYWNLADQYVLFDHFFSSATGGAVQNHMFAITGAPGSATDAIPREGWGDLPTIFDALEARGISWKFYVQNYDPTVTFRNRESGGAQVARVPLLAYARYVDDPRLAAHIVDLDTYYDDLRKGALPAVAYIAPASASEQPPGDARAGQRLVKGLLNALMSSSAWLQAAFLLTYDSSGGWYDHVAPPQVDQYGYGFRVPALLVSPYARRGAVVGATLDFTSILKFIENNYGLPALTDRDAQAASLAAGFDFAAPARPAQIVPAVRGVPPRAEPRRPVLYLAYFGAPFLSFGIIAGATRSWRSAAREPRRRRRGREDGGT